MGKLGFIRLSDESVKKIKKYLKGFYNQRVLNLSEHHYVIRETYGEGLTEETKLYNELVLWLRYFEALTSKRPTHILLLSKIRTDYNTLFSFVRMKNDLSSFIGLTDIDVVGGAVYEVDYIPKIDVFLQGLYDLARCVALKQGSRRNDQMGFINMRPEEVNRLMKNVKEAANNMISHKTLEVRDVLNNDPLVLSLNRLVYLCRVVYAMSRSWKDLQEICVDRINLLRRRLVLAFYERPVFSRVYVRNALEKSVDHTSAYMLLRRLEDDYLLFRNALKWGDPNWGVGLESGSSDSFESGSDDNEIENESTRGGCEYPIVSDIPNETCVDEEECRKEDDEMEKYLKVKMVNGRPMRWWTPTGIPPQDGENGAVWVDEYGNRMSDPMRGKKSKDFSEKKKTENLRDEERRRKTAEENEVEQALKTARLFEEEEKRRRGAEEAELREAEKARRAEELDEDTKIYDNDDDEEKALFDEASDVYEDALSSPKTSSKDLFSKDTPVQSKTKDDGVFVTKDGRVYLPFPLNNETISPFDREISQSDDKFPLLSYVDEKYFKPYKSDSSLHNGKIRVKHSSAKQSRSKHAEKSKIYGTRPPKTEDDYYWDNTGSPIEGDKHFERLVKSDEDMKKLHLDMESMKLDDQKVPNDSIQINPPKPRQFAHSPFTMVEESQPSDSSGFTVLTHDTNEDKSLGNV